MTGVRAEITVEGLEACPLAAASARTGGTVTAATWVSSTWGSDPPREQFSLRGADIAPTEIDLGAAVPVREVFDVGDTPVYEFDRSFRGCVCEWLEALNWPVADVRAEDGTLLLVFHLFEDEIAGLLDDLKRGFDRVGVRYLARESDAADPVIVDRGRLTDRQLEVLETAYRMGYFEHPREATATDIADTLGISQPTFSQHLSAAQSKLMTEFLGDRDVARS